MQRIFQKLFYPQKPKYRIREDHFLKKVERLQKTVKKHNFELLRFTLFCVKKLGEPLMQGSFPQAVLSIELEFSDLGWYFFEKI